jgi:2'-5' RNA ligase
MPRLFIAIELAEPVRKQLSLFQYEAKEKIKDIAWVKPGAMHLTLKFLGEVPEENIGAIGVALEKALKTAGDFKMEVKGTGAFPGWSAPKVVWAGIKNGRNELINMNAALEREMETLGFKKEPHAYVPHLTLGRVKGKMGKEREKAEEHFRKKQDHIFGGQAVSEVVLMQSTLTPEGAVYKKLKSQKLRVSLRLDP